MRWRAMQASDLAAVVAIAAAVHPGFPERPEVLDERRQVFPKGAFLAEDAAGEPVGYALAHPWRLSVPPALDSFLGALPEDADCLYLHDVALLPVARGQGLARALVAKLEARAGGLGRLALTAVNASADRWCRLGFAPTPAGPVLAAKLASYGPGAVFMVKDLSRSPSRS